MEYLKENEFEFEDSFAWWNYKKLKYPILAKLAYQYLAISAISIASKRLFSNASNLLSAKRTHLDAKFFRRTLFLKRNADCIANIHPSQ